MGNVRTWEPYTEGRRIGGCEILEVLCVDKRRRSTNYRIKRLCCGREYVKSHAWIADNAPRAVRCAECSNALNNDERAVDRPTSIVSIDACGMTWTTLGPLGMR